MRRSVLILLAVSALAAPGAALAQYGGSRNAPAAPSAQDDAKKKGDWNLPQGVLPDINAAGPCPYVKVLYDAARYEEFKDNRQSASTVGFTGEIQNLRAQCTYKEADPIRVKMNVLFELGRGPAAESDSKTYRYWVAVTFRNQAVIEKQYFDLPVKFGANEDRVYQSEDIEDIVIPRASKAVSGNNFEILVGFDVTPQMADFNREGKRFRITSTGQTASATPNQ